MCLCTPEVRTPFCGKPGCEWPKPEGVKLIPVQPIGREESPAFVHRTSGCSFEMVIGDVFPPEQVARGNAFRDFRVSLDLSLREAAKILGLSAVDMSSLERGHKTLSEQDWQAARAVLGAGPERRKGAR